MRVLVTAGPTREPIDPVRFLSNRSSGRMGYAIAEALRAAGHQVVLVTGPTALEPPRGVRAIRVETAREMLAACKEHWPRSEALVAVAAVSDFRPARVSKSKWKRGQGDGAELALVPNPDILATLARRKGGRTVVGFALESGDGRRAALAKLAEKRLDWVVLNGPEAQGAERATLRLFDAEGGEQVLGPGRKEALARRLVRAVFGPAAARSR